MRENTAPALSVTGLVQQLKTAVETSLGRVWVRGEVTSLKVHGTGHWYFTLRDTESSVRSVMWKTYTQKMKELPSEGTEVFVLGTPGVWARKGELHFSVLVMLPTAGIGVQQLAKERVRAALEKDGLFAASRKRSLPEFPRTVAVVTSQDGAALRDMITVARRRWPAIRLVIVASRVQGDEAPAALARALAVVNRLQNVDLCIVGRGGGAREDLAAFDDERVCRAVADLRIPSISAVGHEVDVSLTDLVADVRAETPSAAMERALPDRNDCLRAVGVLGNRLARSLSRRTELVEARLGRTGDRLLRAIEARVRAPKAGLELLAGQLEALSPLRVLSRGYSVARLSDGTVVKRETQLPAGTAFRLRVSDGEVNARSER